MSRLLSLLFLCGLLASCGGRNPRPQQPAAGAEKQYVVLPPVPPATLTPAEQRDFVREHYWDRFDFADTLFVHKADSAQMFDCFLRFVALLADHPEDPAPVADLMKRASVSRSALDYFAELAGKVFADPNSPLRNDEFYIPVLQAQLAAPFYDEYERIAPRYALDLAMQNRIGHKANDLRYTLASGKSASLYAIGADYLLLFINNPGCPMCREIREAIVASPLLSDMIADGRLKVLALYPDEDLTEWHAYHDHIPAAWINAYDKGCVLRETSSYNLSAIPSLYLLDRDKRVLLKDATDVGLVEATLVDRNAVAAL